MIDIGNNPDLARLAPAGHYIALRIGFAFPLEEINALPRQWTDYYRQTGLMPYDPVLRWVYSHEGVTRWSALQSDDPKRILEQARRFGLRYGAVATTADAKGGLRSYGIFLRGDREFSDSELRVIEGLVMQLHEEKAPPSNLTSAELEVLGMVKNGLRLKQIAHQIGVTEGAIKQRLKNARLKLGAATGTQAATLASDFGLI